MGDAIAWVTNNWPGLAFMFYVILNELIVLSPKLSANSFVQVLLPFLKKYNPVPEPVPPPTPIKAA